MLTNIFLGLILGVIIGVFLILNNKIIQLQKSYLKLIDTLSNQSDNIKDIVKILDKLLERFNKRILVDNEHFEILNSSINNKFKALNYNDDYIKERLDAIGNNTRDLIMEEHKYTRNEIKKLAKISSKSKSNPKTNKSINHNKNVNKS